MKEAGSFAPRPARVDAKVLVSSMFASSLLRLGSDGSVDAKVLVSNMFASNLQGGRAANPCELEL